MLFFHPGGLYGSTGAVYVFGPQYLLDEDIVLVTGNYRLGSLGKEMLLYEKGRRNCNKCINARTFGNNNNK